MCKSYPLPPAALRPFKSAATRGFPAIATAFVLGALFASDGLAEADRPPVDRRQESWLAAPAGRASLGRSIEQPEAAFFVAQASSPAVLPSLVLPPGVTTEPPLFTSLMQMADAAMVRGDILRARALYERAAAIHPTATAPRIAAGKTYDPNVLPAFGGSSSFADVARAREWYGRAQALGDPDAATFLASLR